MVAPADKGTLLVVRKLVVERIFAVSALLCATGVFQGGASLAVALLLVLLETALAAATAVGVAFC